MKQLQQVMERIIKHVNINLREHGFDAGPHVLGLIPLDSISSLYACYGLSAEHPLHFKFQNSSLAGSYFLGKCEVENSIIHKSDLRGDELKLKGSVVEQDGFSVSLNEDEKIIVKQSFLEKTLVHNFSHDLENLEEFTIEHTVSMPYANIHGAPCEGSFLGAFSTIDLTTVHDCVIGIFAYVQTGELDHQKVEPGRIWVKGPDFEFDYSHDPAVLEKYISHKPATQPEGEFINFRNSYKSQIHQIFSSVKSNVCEIEYPDSIRGVPVDEGASLSEFAVVRGDCRLGKNVLVAQRAYLENAILNNGANAQENCFIIDSELGEFDITAHGGKIISAKLGKGVFTGFNSFLRGSKANSLTVGEYSIIMPHTIIDLEEPLVIPDKSLVWGYIRNASDLALHSVSIDEMILCRDGLSKGSLTFKGNGKSMVHAFEHRIQHILEVNGAFYDGSAETKGHAQMSQRINFNILQPYAEGDYLGMHPTMEIKP